MPFAEGDKVESVPKINGGFFLQDVHAGTPGVVLIASPLGSVWEATYVQPSYISMRLQPTSGEPLFAVLDCH